MLRYYFQNLDVFGQESTKPARWPALVILYLPSWTSNDWWLLSNQTRNFIIPESTNKSASGGNKEPFFLFLNVNTLTQFVPLLSSSTICMSSSPPPSPSNPLSLSLSLSLWLHILTTFGPSYKTWGKTHYGCYSFRKAYGRWTPSWLLIVFFESLKKEDRMMLQSKSLFCSPFPFRSSPTKWSSIGGKKQG